MSVRMRVGHHSGTVPATSPSIVWPIEPNGHGTEVVLTHANMQKMLVVIASAEAYGKSVDLPFPRGIRSARARGAGQEQDGQFVTKCDDSLPAGLWGRVRGYAAPHTGHQQRLVDYEPGVQLESIL